MNNTNASLYIGFKGKNNSSCILAQAISENHCLLTNSFGGLKKDIELLNSSYERVIMFGIDKNLKNSARLERAAEKETVIFSVLDLEEISDRLSANGITNCICSTPSHYLCNEAYWHALHKFKGNVVFIHIPTIKNMNNEFIEKMKSALG